MSSTLDAVLATLMDLQWDPVQPWEWVDPSRSTWTLDGGNPHLIRQVKQQIEGNIKDDLALKISAHYLGVGVDGILDVHCAKQHLQRLWRKA